MMNCIFLLLLSFLFDHISLSELVELKQMTPTEAFHRRPCLGKDYYFLESEPTDSNLTKSVNDNETCSIGDEWWYLLNDHIDGAQLIYSVDDILLLSVDGKGSKFLLYNWKTGALYRYAVAYDVLVEYFGNFIAASKRHQLFSTNPHVYLSAFRMSDRIFVQTKPGIVQEYPSGAEVTISELLNFRFENTINIKRLQVTSYSSLHSGLLRDLLSLLEYYRVFDSTPFAFIKWPVFSLAIISRVAKHFAFALLLYDISPLFQVVAKCAL